MPNTKLFAYVRDMRNKQKANFIAMYLKNKALYMSMQIRRPKSNLIIKSKKITTQLIYNLYVCKITSHLPLHQDETLPMYLLHKKFRAWQNWLHLKLQCKYVQEKT